MSSDNQHEREMPLGVACAYLGIALVTVAANFLPIPVYTHMMLDVLLVLYIGAHNSVKVLASPAEGEESDQQIERLETSDVLKFPLVGSAVLFGLYLVFKFLPKEYVNLIIKGYFFLFGAIVLGTKISAFIGSFLPRGLSASLTATKWTFRIPLSHHITGAEARSVEKDGETVTTDPDEITITKIDILAILLAIVVAVWYLKTNHWAASNLFGIAFSIQGIELISLGSYKNGCILLSGLFFYDIFWVFGTDVMVTVAKSFDAPIKLLFPQTVADMRPSMLGLGDIVIPGLFIAFMLRFDHYINSKNPDADSVEGGSKYYFWVIMFFYFVGLTTTVLVMYAFEAAQPALLYLVPACLIGSAVPALMKGQFSTLWSWEEGSDEGADAKKDN